MKLTIPREILVNALAVVSPLCAKWSTLPILSSFRGYEPIPRLGFALLGRVGTTDHPGSRFRRSDRGASVLLAPSLLRRSTHRVQNGACSSDVDNDDRRRQVTLEMITESSGQLGRRNHEPLE